MYKSEQQDFRQYLRSDTYQSLLGGQKCHLPIRNEPLVGIELASRKLETFVIRYLLLCSRRYLENHDLPQSMCLGAGGLENDRLGHPGALSGKITAPTKAKVSICVSFMPPSESQAIRIDSQATNWPFFDTFQSYYNPRRYRVPTPPSQTPICASSTLGVTVG